MYMLDLGAWAQPTRCAVFDGKSRPVLIVNDCAKMTGRHSAAVHKYLSQAFSPRKLLNIINLIKICDFIFNISTFSTFPDITSSPCKYWKVPKNTAKSRRSYNYGN